MLKVIELFAGLGSQTQALKNIGVEHEVVAISEIDKYCLKSYEALHGKPNNLGDICKIERLPKADLWTYSFPCQDVSIAGKLAGINEGTRSGLLYEVERLLKIANEEGTLPKYLLLENVKNLVSKRFKPDFDKWLDFLSSIGYTNYWKVLNAKDYGIPQNRERVFCVSILNFGSYEFPEKKELKLKLRDLLENEVDEKYYLSQKVIACFMKEDTKGFNRKERFMENIEHSDGEIGHAITTRSGSRPTDNFVVEKTEQERRCDEALKSGELEEGDVINHSHDNPVPVNSENPDCAPTLTTRGDELGVVVMGNYSPSGHNAARVVDPDGIAPTVMENHGTVTAIPIKNNTKKGFLMAEEGDAVDISGRMQYHRGTVQKGISQTITTAGGDNVGVVVKDKSLFSETEKKLFTEDGNIRRYIGSDKVDEFKEGQMATTSFPNGYGHGPRVHDESVSLNTIDKPCVKYNLRIRKLTPRECLRLMGWNDEQIDKIQASGVSHSQQYKQAGNGIVVQVLEEIFKNLFKKVEVHGYEQLNLFDFNFEEDE